jgi:hypothetical protein
MCLFLEISYWKNRYWENKAAKVTIDLKKTARDIGDWLEQMSVGLELGRFRFCGKGSLVPIEGKAGLMATCFAMRSAWQAGIWDEWPRDKKDACINFIKSFQREDGIFYDPWLSKKTGFNLSAIGRILIRRKSYYNLKEQKKLNQRAETRQCIGDLYNVGESPLYPAPVEHLNFSSFPIFWDSLSWETPWAAGSHLSHLMCFLSVNKLFFSPVEHHDSLIKQILKLLSDLHDNKTGAWFSGRPGNLMKINGAMKVLSGLQWIEFEPTGFENLVDFALAQPFQDDGCGMLNRLFVLQQARKGTIAGYRQREIHQTASTALDAIQKFQNPDGGFSFYKHKSQPSYYGVKVSKALNESDLHGTAMMTWAIGVCLDLLGEDGPDGKEKWRFHRA